MTALPLAPLTQAEIKDRRDHEAHMIGVAWARELDWIKPGPVADSARSDLLTLQAAYEMRLYGEARS